MKDILIGKIVKQLRYRFDLNVLGIIMVGAGKFVQE